MKLPCAIVFSTLKASMLRLKDKVPSSGSMCIAWNSIERGDVVILPDSRWSCNWILLLSSIVLRKRFMLSVSMVRRYQKIGWSILLIFGKSGKLQLKCSVIGKILCSPFASLLAFPLRLMAISFLENFPLFRKKSMWSLDVVTGLPDIWSLLILSFNKTLLSWVSKLKKKVVSPWLTMSGSTVIYIIYKRYFTLPYVTSLWDSICLGTFAARVRSKIMHSLLCITS